MTDPTFEMVIGGALISEGVATCLCAQHHHSVLIDSLRGKDDVWKQLRPKHKTLTFVIRQNHILHFNFAPLLKLALRLCFTI